MKLFCFLGLFGLFALATNADPLPKPTLKGVTIATIPYTTLKNDSKTFEGYAVDLIQKIADKVGFNYELSLSPDGKYGIVNPDGTVNGMIGEVASKKADFAIADLTITELRKQHVAFTEPFLESHFAVLVRKDDVGSAKNLEDLQRANELAAKSDPPGKQFNFMIIASGSTNAALNETKDEIGKAIYQSIRANGNKSLFKSYSEGMERLLEGRDSVIIGESAMLEFRAAHNCNLMVLPDNRGLYPKGYGIALQKDSPYLEAFNKAIRELKADGTLQQLKERYWASTCK